MSDGINRDTPILDGLIASGDVRIERTSFIGIAHDGVEVSLGIIYNPLCAENYLRDHPTPKDW